MVSIRIEGATELVAYKSQSLLQKRTEAEGRPPDWLPELLNSVAPSTRIDTGDFIIP